VGRAGRTVGIDLAIRGAHVATIVDADGNTVGRPVRFRLSSGDLTDLVSRIRSGVAADDKVVAVVEPTGVGLFSGGALAGTCRLYVPSAPQQALNRLTKQRARYQEQICSTRRRLLDLIRWAAPPLERALPELTTMVALAFLDQYFDPPTLLELGREKLIAFLREHVGGNHPAHGEFAEQLAGRLLEAAQATLDLHGHGSVDFVRLQLEVRQEIQLLRLWREHLHVLDREIATPYAQLDADALLQSLPGIGTILGPSLLGVLHTWRRFGSQARLRGFCGLFPTRNESGGVDRGGQRITQGGNNRLKRDLILAADVARTVDPELAAVYYRCIVDKGHHHRQALCAVATRLANRVHAVLKSGRPYCLRDLTGQPISVAAGRAFIREPLQVPTTVRQQRRRRTAVGPAAVTSALDDR
jgi:hypothetical protein